MIGDFICVTIPNMSIARQLYIEPNFENYRTLAFTVERMETLIGTGTPTFTEAGEFLGFEHHWKPTPGRIHPSLTLQLGVWLSFVPEVYRAEAERGAVEVGERFEGEKIDSTFIRCYVAELRRWIGENVEPVT